jgi:uroporphyrinogen decarboxylase
MDSRERVIAAVNRTCPDRQPVDFLATTEIWKKLSRKFGYEDFTPGPESYYDETWERILQDLAVDCRVISYDQFCEPPQSIVPTGSHIEQWQVLSRSTPARMWRMVGTDGFTTDIFGRRFRIQSNETGSYEENLPVLAGAESLGDLKRHPWPDPAWWDFSPVPQVITRMNQHGPKHVRYRMGSVFEIAWQLRGMEAFFMDLALQPEMAEYLLDRITEISVENTRKVLKAAGDDIDMVYFYDDIASNNSLMLSREMWEEFIKPHHEALIAVARQFGKKVMYHSDGSLASILVDLIDMGVDVLNPIQPNTSGMEPSMLKKQYGSRLSFHGGIDIVNLLPKGSTAEVRAEVQRLSTLLGEQGGYIMASSHHIQPDTPLENILALYDLTLR